MCPAQVTLKNPQNPLKSFFTYCFIFPTADEESPQVIDCSDDIEEQSSTRLSPVVWDEPVFKDNSGEDLMVITNRQSGSNFSWGLPEEVWYNAKDKAGNNVSCEFTVSVKRKSVLSDFIRQ